MPTTFETINTQEGSSGNTTKVDLPGATNKYDGKWLRVTAAANSKNINKVVKLKWSKGSTYTMSPYLPEETTAGDTYQVFDSVAKIDRQGTNPETVNGCFSMPQLEDVTLSFPLGLKLSPLLPPGVANTNCAVAFNLLAQLNALLPILAVLLKLLQCIGILFELIKWVMDNIPPKNIFGVLTIFVEFAKQIAKLTECVGFIIPSIIPPIGFICLIESIIKLIMMLLKCVQTTLETTIKSIKALGVSLKITVDDPNDDLLKAIKCFIGDFDTNMNGLKVIMATVLEIINIYTLAKDIIGHGDDVDTTSISNITSDIDNVMSKLPSFDIEDLSEYVDGLDDMIAVMEVIPKSIDKVVKTLAIMLAPLSLLCGGKIPNFIIDQ